MKEEPHSSMLFSLLCGLVMMEKIKSGLTVKKARISRWQKNKQQEGTGWERWLPCLLAQHERYGSEPDRPVLRPGTVWGTERKKICLSVPGSSAGKVDAGKGRIHHEPFCPDVWDGICRNGDKQ